VDRTTGMCLGEAARPRLVRSHERIQREKPSRLGERPSGRRRRRRERVAVESATVTETYTSGTWIVRPGHEDAFVQEWTAFVTWASSMPGSGTFRLVRDMDHPRRYMSFAPWQSFEAQHAWKQLPEFPERIGRVRSHCEDFRPSTHELVTEVA
jgi:heme-degrading monooxygenase HmoA